MNILIISYYFSPINRIASIRMSKVAEKLALQNHKVDVICFETDKRVLEDLSYSNIISDHTDINIHRLKWNSNSLYEKTYYNILTKLKKRKAQHSASQESKEDIDNLTTKNSGRSLKSMVLNTFIDCLYNKKNKIMAKPAYKALDEMKNSRYTPDVIIASYEPLLSLLIGQKAKKLWPTSRLVFDFRDVMTNHYYGKHSGMIENHIYNIKIKEERHYLQVADRITVVSNGQKNMILDRQSSIPEKKISVIYNGFDRTDGAPLPECQKTSSDEKMVIVFTGTLQKYKLKAFEWMLKRFVEMFASNMITKKQILIKYAGHNAEEVRQFEKSYDLNECMEIHEHIAREESLKMQASADFLLNLVWNEQYDQGILGGKFGEYMLYKKPILGIVTGDKPNSDLFVEIYTRQIGECFETVSGESEKLRFMSFICDYLIGKRSYEYHPHCVDDFIYENIAAKFIEDTDQ